MNNKLYVRLDVDNAGDSIELALLKSDYKEAQNVHDKIQNSINSIFKKIKNINSTKILMKGCDDILFSIEKDSYDLNLLKELKNDFKLESGFTLSIGVASNITECMLSLRVAKISGKDKIVEKNYS
ncbi:mCpol domain-containing protein [Tenacibaculum discolor]|uniref:mCpol domain-containing protein n=1 Tax=Tenacibaculum discolor TaxID=361581 RepID=UPI000F5B3188|nr:mCpol domain-containing protein [Tenacibaculum discolor]